MRGNRGVSKRDIDQ